MSGPRLAQRALAPALHPHPQPVQNRFPAYNCLDQKTGLASLVKNTRNLGTSAWIRMICQGKSVVLLRARREGGKNTFKGQKYLSAVCPCDIVTGSGVFSPVAVFPGSLRPVFAPELVLGSNENLSEPPPTSANLTPHTK